MDDMTDDASDETSATPEPPAQAPAQPRWMVPSLLLGAAAMLLVLLAVLRVF